MRQVLLKYAVLLSTLIGLASLALMVRGNRHRDHITWASAAGHFVEFDSWDGSLFVSAIRSEADRALAWQVSSRDDLPYPCAVLYSHATLRSHDWGVATFEESDAGAVFWDRGVRSTIHPIVLLQIEWEMIALLAAILPTGAACRRGWIAYKRRRARLAGCCMVCGYDLRATPRVCPECGCTGDG